MTTRQPVNMRSYVTKHKASRTFIISILCTQPQHARL